MTTTSTVSWLAQVLNADPDFYKIPYVYQFSNNRIFNSTDHTNSGIYGKGIEDESGFVILDESGSRILREA